MQDFWRDCGYHLLERRGPERGAGGHLVVTDDFLRAYLNRPEVRPEIGEHTSELQSLMRISYAVFCLKKKRHRMFIRTLTSTRKLAKLSMNRSNNMILISPPLTSPANQK